MSSEICWVFGHLDPDRPSHALLSQRHASAACRHVCGDAQRVGRRGGQPNAPRAGLSHSPPCGRRTSGASSRAWRLPRASPMARNLGREKTQARAGGIRRWVLTPALDPSALIADAMAAGGGRRAAGIRSSRSFLAAWWMMAGGALQAAGLTLRFAAEPAHAHARHLRLAAQIVRHTHTHTFLPIFVLCALYHLSSVSLLSRECSQYEDALALALTCCSLSSAGWRPTSEPTSERETARSAFFSAARHDARAGAWNAHMSPTRHRSTARGREERVSLFLSPSLPHSHALAPHQRSLTHSHSRTLRRVPI